jgi:hypothetical protein
MRQGYERTVVARRAEGPPPRCLTDVRQKGMAPVCGRQQVTSGRSAVVSVVLGVGPDHGVGVPTELQEFFVE